MFDAALRSTMSSTILRSKLLRMASTMPKGSSERKALLEVLAKGSTTAAKGGLTPEVIKQIAEMTDNNHHGGAVAALAKALGNKDKIKIMDHIMGIHDILKHMPYGLIQVRSEIRDSLLKEAKSKLDGKLYDSLEEAF